MRIASDDTAEDTGWKRGDSWRAVFALPERRSYPGSSDRRAGWNATGKRETWSSRTGTLLPSVVCEKFRFKT